MATPTTTPSAASSRTSSLPFTKTTTKLRHLVKCCREITPFRRHSAQPDANLLFTHESDCSMPNVVEPIKKSNNPSESIDQSNTSYSVSGVSKDGHVDTIDTIDTYTIQRGRKDSPFDESCNQGPLRLPTETISTSKKSPQKELVEVHERPLPSQIEEKDIGLTSTVTVSLATLSSGSLPLPETRPRQRFQNLCLHWFTAYRILIGLTFIVNVAVLIAYTESTRRERLALSGPLTATAANIFVAVLIRQEDLINVSFTFIAKTPASLPLWLRKMIADLHHYGGLHIGCSIAALLWYSYFVFLNTSFFLDLVKQKPATGWMWADISTCFAFLLAILVVCILAHPRLRTRFHDTFEQTHRFGGWTALLVLWINAGVASHNPSSPPLYANAALWLLAGTTFLIILPWTRMRRVPITAELVSSREVRLTFPYKNMPYTSTMRFSLSPLMEWHAFATIPIRASSTLAISSAYVVISQAGDWTKSIIASPPTHIWLRKPATKNFLVFAPLFNSLLLVGTGAGIGPLLSLLSSPVIAQMREQGKQVRVMWCVFDPEAAHWAFVQEIIRQVDSQPRIFDSRRGRPDMAFETDLMRRECGIEAVMVVSNPIVTKEVVEEIKRKGGTAYGAVFDS
ncbi:hypothetical protein G6011_03897 [Alternaria panax]|uniref:Nonribosomal peptide synthetase 12 n=1 Tax=Alternaria panax TaxID=48097 RepID=A0AAD4IG12_9PLEO|nr:hypothetical protein G6011_03897 [Alternaria panax]